MIKKLIPLFLIPLNWLFCNEGLLTTYLTHTSQQHIFEELRQLGRLCDSCVEINSPQFQATWALMQGQSENRSFNKSYFKVSKSLIDHPTVEKAVQLAENCGIEFCLSEGGSIETHFDSADLLLLSAELDLDFLEKACDKVSKYIVIEGLKENQPFSWSQYTKSWAWAKILDFLDRHPQWQLKKRLFDAPWLVILQKLPAEVATKTRSIDGKVILCTGPSFNNRKALKEVTENDLSLIPFKKIFIATNDRNIMDITFPGIPTQVEYIEPRGGKKHDLDCANCIISSINQALNDPDTRDDDIILFKHETVFINDLYLIRKALEKCTQGFDAVIRKTPDRWYMTDVFILRVSAARRAFAGSALLPSFNRIETSCEEYSKVHILPACENPYLLDNWDHSLYGPNELGTIHTKKNVIGDKPIWDRKNYQTVY